MPGLSLSLLGTFRVHRDASPTLHFETNKARALLAYLIVENRPHTRLHLAGLLWPDWPESAARTYLRQALLNLRQTLENPVAAPPYLLSNRQTIQFNPDSDHWLDMAVLSRALMMLPRLSEIDALSEAVQALEDALLLYQGDFLEGFFVDGCAAFEEWQLLTREDLRRKVVDAACFLLRWYERRGDWGPAQRWARRSVELEPLLEESHLQLMRLLALNGDRNAALEHYARYRRQLSAELDAAPSPEVTELYERIKAGQFPGQTGGRYTLPGSEPTIAAEVEIPFPFFLTEAIPVPACAPLCLARERELALLRAHLDRAISGLGGVVFVKGEAGRGKTVLLQAFVDRSQEEHTPLVAVGGNCSSHEGIGDALLPFREILAQLSGDFEAQWAAGTIRPEHAGRLWSVFPETVQALLSYGPDLPNTLIPGQSLAARVTLLPDGESQVRQLEAVIRARAPIAQQRALFDQFTRVLQALARHHPLLLWIDDLHWVDRASSALLFHLGQRLAGYPLLIVGTYRSEEVATGTTEGERHPLEKVLRELQGRFGAVHIDLDQAESRPFVDVYLDLEPNRLNAAFREKLYRLSEGHPLYTVELTRAMRERNGLVQDSTGSWTEGPALEWDRLPSRLEAVIGERVDRLPAAQRTLVDVASVEGEVFTAEVIADALGHDVQGLIRQLSNGLDRQHHLVASVDIQNVGNGHLSHYRFRHVLFQKYLYSCLNAPERRQLHEAVARSLEFRTQDQPHEAATAAGQIARHFEQADLCEPAIPYACLAGNRALQMSANEEAVAYYRWGLRMLSQLPTGNQDRRLEVDLQMGLGTALAMAERHTALPVQEALTRASELCRELNDLSGLFRALWGLWRFRLVRGEARASLETARECMEIAQQTSDTSLVMQALEAVGCTLYRVGEMKRAQEHLAEGRRLYVADRHRVHAHRYGQDPGVSCPANEAQVLWYLGYGDQARARMNEALALAEDHGHTASIAFALIFRSGLYQRVGDAESTLKFSERTIEYSRLHGFGQWVAVGTLYRGWAMFSLGRSREGLALMREGFEATLQAEVIQLRFAALVAEATGLSGDVVGGLATITELLQRAHSLGELEWAAEMYRVKGELSARQGSDEAIACFERAIALAREQGARSLELRALTGLARVCRRSGKPDDVIERLAQTYHWFTEGFDMPDLLAAHELLAELGALD